MHISYLGRCYRRWSEDGAFPGGARPPETGAPRSALPRCQGECMHYPFVPSLLSAEETFNL